MSDKTCNCEMCQKSFPKKGRRIDIKMTTEKDSIDIVLCSVECLIDWSVELYDIMDSQDLEEEKEKSLEEPLTFTTWSSTPENETRPAEWTQNLTNDQLIQLLNDNEADEREATRRAETEATPNPGFQEIMLSTGRNLSVPITTNRDFNPNQWVMVGRSPFMNTEMSNMPSAGEQRIVPRTWGDVERSTEPAFRSRFFTPENTTFSLTNPTNRATVTNTQTNN